MNPITFAGQRLFLIALPLLFCCCEKAETIAPAPLRESPVAQTNADALPQHLRPLLEAMSAAEVARLREAAATSRDIHPYLRDYLLGIVAIRFEAVLYDSLNEWREAAPDDRLLCGAIEKMRAVMARQPRC